MPKPYPISVPEASDGHCCKQPASHERQRLERPLRKRVKELGYEVVKKPEPRQDADPDGTPLTV
jgi:hypothetical protein